MGKENYGVGYIPLIDVLNKESASFDEIKRAFKGASRHKVDISSKRLEERFYELIGNSKLSKEKLMQLHDVFERCAISLTDRQQKHIAQKYKDLATYLYHEGI